MQSRSSQSSHAPELMWVRRHASPPEASDAVQLNVTAGAVTSSISSRPLVPKRPKEEMKLNCASSPHSVQSC